MDFLLQEFNCEIIDKKDSKNLVADHLSRIIHSREIESNIFECFPDEQLFVAHTNPWYNKIVNYLVSSKILKGWTKNDRDRFFHLVKCFVCEDPYLFKYYSN